MQGGIGMECENMSSGGKCKEEARGSKGDQYWTEWVNSSGSCHVVAAKMLVSKATVSEHIATECRKRGFKDAKDAKRKLGLHGSLAGSEDRVSAAMLKSVLEIQEYKCALSGKRLTPKTAVLDRKIPLSKGGTNHISNLQWLDSMVNKAKGSMDCDEFVDMCKSVAKQARG